MSRILFLIVLLILPLRVFGLDAHKALDATVVIYSADGRDTFLGSGFAFLRPDLIVTNAHVVGQHDAVHLKTRTGAVIRATVSLRAPDRELALLSAQSAVPGVLMPARGQSALVSRVYALGAPLQAEFTVTEGIVSALKRQIDPTQPVSYIQHSAAVNPGSSGGPLVNTNGEVVGINTRIADGSRFFAGIAYAIPISEAQALAAAGRHTPLPELGVNPRALSSQFRAALAFGGHGVLVDHVVPKGAADKAGLRAGDILIRVGMRDVHRPGDLAFALADLGGTRAGELVIERRGRVLHLTLRFAAKDNRIVPVSSGDVLSQKRYALPDMGIVANAKGDILDMAHDGAGFFAGLSVGDRIQKVNGVDVTELAETWPETLQIEEPVLLLIALQDGSTRHYLLDPWTTRHGMRPVSGANVLDEEVVSFK